MQLGKYEIIRELGRGGFGIVYQAKDLTLERMVALKVLHPQLTIDLKFTQTFQREARNLAQIDHPNVVTIFEIGEIEGRIYIAMRYLPGGSLSDRLKAEGPIHQEEAIKILSQVSEGLQAGHKRGIIHRDVKPGNILIDENGQAVIADFGVARAVELSSMGTSSESGGAVGTPHYRPLELWRGSPPPSAASDVYSLACVAYEILTGQVLFSGDTPDQVLTRHVLEEASSLLEQGGEHIHQPMLEVLKQALAKDPKDRYQSITEFSQELSQALEKPKGSYRKTKTGEEPVRKPALPWNKADKKVKIGTSASAPGKPLNKVYLFGLAAILILAVSLGVWANNRTGKNASVIQQISSGTPPLGASQSELLSTLPTETQTKLSADVSSPLPTERPTITPTLAPIAMLTIKPTVISTRVRDKDGMEQVYVPAGNFIMGSEGGDNDEVPVHEVYLDAFWIDKFEVTNARYKACVAAGKCSAPSEKRSNLRNSYYGNLTYDDYPVIYVTWAQANAYCEWAGGRLPTEAEWEKAARGDQDSRTYPWGEGIDLKIANYDSFINDTTKVGLYPSGASPYGAMDMAGNVYEWVSDWYERFYYDSQSEWRNPTGGTSGIYRVIRGGSWISPEKLLRVSVRYGNVPEGTPYDVGFRCVGGDEQKAESQSATSEQSGLPTPDLTETPTSTPESNLSEIQIREKDKMEMVFIPSGSFTMGADIYQARPIHQVYLDDYWIDKFEVTNAQYQLCITAGVCDVPINIGSRTRNSYLYSPEFADFPVISVDWYQAKKYCEWAGGRLPTEAEWEKAARGAKDTRSYPWGEGIDNQKANYGWELGDTTKAGSYPAGASPYGVMDMAGNVSEWVSDLFDQNYYGSQTEWSNPTGPSTGEMRTFRGGSFITTSELLRVSSRGAHHVVSSNYSIETGIRCVGLP